MFFKFYILLALVGSSLCAVWHAYPPPIPEKYAGQEGCYIKEIDKVVKFGEIVKPIGHCYRITCGEMMSYASCGSVGATEPCYVTEKDLTKPYPDCCPRIECPPIPL